MRKFDIDRVNLKKIELGENPIVLKNNKYQKPRIKHNRLVDKNGKKIGTKGDMYHKLIMDKILQEGFLDITPRPKYKDFYKFGRYYSNDRIVVTHDGEEIKLDKSQKAIVTETGVEIWTPAHTLSVNQGIECSYDLSKGESPMITLRPIAYKTSIDEIRWIYQLQSNDLVDFDELIGKNTWDVDHVIHNWWKDWALRDANGNYILNEKGHPIIGHCYGGTTAKWNMLYHYVIDQIKANKDGRRNITCMWQLDDFEKPHGLKPCAYETTWNVGHGWDGKDYLDMTLTQRSSDFATAGCINQVQYAALLKMVAAELDLEPGIFTWKPVNVQLYDRHLDGAIDLLNRKPINCKATIEVNKEIKKFKDFTTKDVCIKDYPLEKIKKKNPQISLQLGI